MMSNLLAESGLHYDIVQVFIVSFNFIQKTKQIHM